MVVLAGERCFLALDVTCVWLGGQFEEEESERSELSGCRQPMHGTDIAARHNIQPPSHNHITQSHLAPHVVHHKG
jgi:hypothetical protein